MTMDILQELENMAINIEDECDVEYRPAEDEIARWQKIFSYSYVEAAEHIKNQKSDISPCRVSDELWTLLRSEKEAQGYSREAFEHEMRSRSIKPISTKLQTVGTTNSISLPDTTYLVLLSGPLISAQQIQTIASLPSLPTTLPATSEKTGDSHVFCRINSSTKQILQGWLARECPLFASTFVRVSQALKDLSSTSIYPTLGIDSTLPQHRLSSLTDASLLPAQNQYPVAYFFYGTLLDPEFVAQLLSLPEEEPPIFKPAHITHGVLKTWSGKYKALIDGAATDIVNGFAYEVTNREREEALLIYETELYEVVRCAIVVEGRGVVRGLSFRFRGPFKPLGGEG